MSAVSAASRAAELTPPPRAPVRVPGRRPHGAALATALAQRAALWTSGQQTTSSSGFSLRSLLSPHLPGPSLRPTRPAFEAHGFLARVRWSGTSPERATATVSPIPASETPKQVIFIRPSQACIAREAGHRELPPSCKRLVPPGGTTAPPEPTCNPESSGRQHRAEEPRVSRESLERNVRSKAHLVPMLRYYPIMYNFINYNH